MNLKTLIIILKTDLKVNQAAAKLRGFIACKFPDHILLHQHNGDKFVYSYPWVQYKVIDEHLIVVGINEGLDDLKKIYTDINSINLGESSYEIIEKKFVENDVRFELMSFFHQYMFIDPWLALNEKNYEKYQRYGTWKQKKALLEKILIGNILSMSKSLGYTVPAPIKANIINMKEVPTKLKGTPMLGFLGTFSINFEIPDYWGIGKSVSRGFGTVKKRETDDISS